MPIPEILGRPRQLEKIMPRIADAYFANQSSILTRAHANGVTLVFSVPVKQDLATGVSYVLDDYQVHSDDDYYTVIWKEGL